MAEIVIKVTTEGGEKSLKNINDLKSAITQLETESANLDLGSEAFENSKKQIDDLKKKYQELAKSQQQLDAETADKANKAVEQHAARAEKIGNNVQKFAAGLTDAFAGAFIALGASEKDAAKLNATLQQGVGIALGVKGGIEAIVAGVELAGPAFEAFNAIIAANPIGAVVIAVAALTAGVYLLVKAFEEEETALDSVNDSLRRNREAHIKNEQELKKISLEKQLREKTITQEQYNRALGEIDLQNQIKDNADFTTKEIIKLYEKYGYDINKQLVLRQKRQDYYTREGVLVQDIAWEKEKKAFDNFNIEYNAIKKAALDKTLDDKKFIDAKAAEATDKANFDEIEKNKGKNKTIAADAQKIQDDRNAQALKDLEIFGKELQNTIDKYLAEQIKSEKAARDKSREDEIDDNDNFYALKHSKAIKAAEDDLIGDRDNLTKKRALLEQQRQEEIRIARLKGEDIAAINKKYVEADEALVDEAFKKKLDNINKYTQAIGSALNSVVGAFQAYQDLQKQEQDQDTKERQEALDTQLTALSDTRDKELAKEGLTNDQKIAINNKYAQQEYQLKLLEYNRNTEVKKKAFEQDKKLKIAQTVISTITGAVAALTSSIQAYGIPYGAIIGALAAAAVTATGAIQIAAINKQKFDAGTPPAAPKIQAPNTSDGGGSGSSNRAQQGPDLYAINGDTNTGQGGSGKRTSNSNNEPIRAYVVTEDISASQNKNAVIERRSSF